jgi:hypothetical protein
MEQQIFILKDDQRLIIDKALHRLLVCVELRCCLIRRPHVEIDSLRVNMNIDVRDARMLYKKITSPG